MSNYWVRVENGNVVECLEYDPQREGDWREAIEIKPNLVANHQVIEGHTFDISKNPVEIVWAKRDLSIEERKDSLLSLVTEHERNTIREQISKELDCSCDSDGICCVDTLISSLAMVRQKKTQISSFTTHEQIDSYMRQIGVF
jgi:hypothetical protein